MFTFISGDLLHADTDVIAHQVNCQGVMGAGLARQIRNIHPVVYTKYKTACEQMTDIDLLGKVQVISTTPYRIANLFAQRYYGRVGRYTDYSALQQCLTKLKDYMLQHNLNSIGLPEGLGCGLAGGSWDVVSTIITRVFTDTDIHVKIYKKEK